MQNFQLKKLFPVSPVGWDNVIVSSILQSTNFVVLKIYKLVHVLVHYQEWDSLNFFLVSNAFHVQIFFNACYICTKSLNHSLPSNIFLNCHNISYFTVKYLPSLSLSLSHAHTYTHTPHMHTKFFWWKQEYVYILVLVSNETVWKYSEGPSREGEISIIVASLTHIQIPLQSCMPNCRMPKKLLFWTILNPWLHSNILSFSYLSKKKKKVTKIPMKLNCIQFPL